MGIFSSKKKDIVDTTVMRVVDDAFLPNSLLKAITKGVLGNTGITDNVLDAALHGTFRNFERMYRWADKPGNYTWGLPNAKVMTSSDGFAAAVAAIESEVGQPIVLDYLHFRPINNVHAGKKWVYENWDWNPETNELEALTALFGGEIPIYLEKFVSVHRSEVGTEPEQSSIGTWDDSDSAGYTPERPAQELADGLQGLVLTQEIRIGPTETESVELHFVWADANGDIQRDVNILDLSSYVPDQEYYQARYTYGIGGLGFWTYDPESGVYPAIDSTFQSEYINPGTYFPFVMFRSEDQNRTADAVMNSEEFKSTEKLCEFIGMNFKELGDTIHENPDINDIDQAVMMLGVPLTGQDPVEMEYLCEYFNNLYDTLPDPAKDDGSRTLKNYYKKSGTPDESYVVAIEDSDFRILLSFDYITKRRKAGNIANDGGIDGFSNTVHFESAVLTLPGNVTVPNTQNRIVRRLRRQLTETIYEEIIVANPQIRYDIYKNKHALGSARDDILIIPVDYNLARKMNCFRREVLYTRSLQFVFNSHVVQKTKWYETGAFKVLLVIAAVVIAIYTGHYEAVTAALATGGVYAAAVVLLQIIVTDFLIGMAIQFAFVKVAEVLGMENTLILAALVAAVGIYYGQTGSAPMMENATAVNLLKASVGLVDAAGTELANDMEDLLKDARQFENLMEDSWEDVERAQDLLDTKNLLNPFEFIAQEPMMVTGEAPSSYFGRTVHAGNVGARSLDIVENFVEISLRLPSLHDSVG